MYVDSPSIGIHDFNCVRTSDKCGAWDERSWWSV